MVIRDAMDDGRKALKILRDYYLGISKLKVISLYTELTTLSKRDSECVTDYMLRAETAASSLKSAAEVISDSLLIAMILKGLPSEYKTLCTVITKKDKELTFAEFKVALRSFEETEKQTSQCDDTVMKVKDAKSIQCFVAGSIDINPMNVNYDNRVSSKEHKRNRDGVNCVNPPLMTRNNVERREILLKL